MQQSLKLDNAEKPAASTKSPRVDYDLPVDPKNWSGMALIGEAPGADEARLGHPFVGRSGQLLNKILEQAKIDRSRCLVANVFRYQPPGNKVDHFFISRRKAAEENVAISERYGKFTSSWVRAEFASEIHHLSETLKRMKPKVIISLGRTALWALTGENGLTENLGKPQPCRLAPDVEVIPTYHPSFILRGNWGLQGAWLNHLLVANQRVV